MDEDQEVVAPDRILVCYNNGIKKSGQRRKFVYVLPLNKKITDY
jgi:hypothetical protein